MMGFGGIFGILLIAVIIWAVIQFTNKNSNFNIKDNPRSGEKDALQILKERYARGEISKEEFEQMKRNLM